MTKLIRRKNRRRYSALEKPKREKKEITYSSGGEGFIKWCEEFVRIKIYVDGLAVWCPIGDLPLKVNENTGRCSRDMWDFQKEIALESLKMRDGRFIHRLIVLCWMRGEGKSLFVCLIQLWKFFNFPAQQIMLGANSKDQVKFVHFDIMRDIILNSPKLIGILGEKNVQEKEIRLKNSRGHVVSIIRSISSFSGIVSNITGYTFSEIFDMRNPKFFTQLDGSIRNIPNALGVIDSTVSSKEHILYNLFTSFKKGLDRTLYFSHRQSVEGDYRDFTNPEMTQDQLNSYRAKFPPREFAMYFKNTWDAGAQKMFTKEVVMAMEYIGWHKSLGEHTKVLGVLENYVKEEEAKGVVHPESKASKALNELIPISKVYKLETEHLQPRDATIDELETLGRMYDTNFALLVGADRADPMRIDIRSGARTMVCLVAKGLAGSRSNPSIALSQVTSVHNHIYFLIGLRHVVQSDINTIKMTIEEWSHNFDGVDTLCTERWGMWDIGDWCEELDITFHPVTASFTTQQDGFSELYNLIQTGRFKAPKTVIHGSKREDILREELLTFDHDPVKKFYGSPEKFEKFGIQDDTVFSINWSIYGGRYLTVEDFRDRKAVTSFGEFHEDKTRLVGEY
jgi:hypothetical protein